MAGSVRELAAISSRASFTRRGRGSRAWRTHSRRTGDVPARDCGGIRRGIRWIGHAGRLLRCWSRAGCGGMQLAWGRVRRAPISNRCVGTTRPAGARTLPAGARPRGTTSFAPSGISRTVNKCQLSQIQFLLHRGPRDPKAARLLLVALATEVLMHMQFRQIVAPRNLPGTRCVDEQNQRY